MGIFDKFRKKQETPKTFVAPTNIGENIEEVNNRNNDRNNDLKNKSKFSNVPHDFVVGTTLMNDNFKITSTNNYNVSDKIADFYIEDRNSGNSMVITTVNYNLQNTADIAFNYCTSLSQIANTMTLFNRNELLRNPGLLKELENKAKLESGKTFEDNQDNLENIENDENKETKETIDESKNEAKETSFKIEILEPNSKFSVFDQNSNDWISVHLEKCSNNLFENYVSKHDDINQMYDEINKIIEYSNALKFDRNKEIIRILEEEQNSKNDVTISTKESIEQNKQNVEVNRNDFNREYDERENQEKDIKVYTSKEFKSYGSTEFIEDVESKEEIHSDEDRNHLFYLVNRNSGEILPINSKIYSKIDLEQLVDENDSLEDIKQIIDEFEEMQNSYEDYEEYDEVDMSDDYAEAYAEAYDDLENDYDIEENQNEIENDNDLNNDDYDDLDY